MIIILEGISKVGKSTLARYIKKEYGFGYIKCSQPKKCGPYKEYMNILNNAKGDIVIDRFHWGEEVFGPLYRNGSKLSREEFNEIEELALKKNAIMIYCFDDSRNIAKRFKIDNEEWEEADKIEKTLALYNEVLDKSAIKTFRHRMKSKHDFTTNGELKKIISTYKFIEKPL